MIQRCRTRNATRMKDTNGNGSEDKPFATLAKAVDAADDGATVYVMSDLTMTAPPVFTASR